MFERVHLPPETKPVALSNENDPIQPLDKKTERYLRRRSTRLGRVTMSLLALSLPASLVHAYWADVRDNQILAATSLPSINEILPPLEGEFHDSATFYAAGFDTRDGDVFARQVGPPIQHLIGGSAESIDYGNAPLDPTEIAHQVITQAEADSLTSINLAGNSLGGLISLRVAEEVIRTSDVDVDTIFLNATPDGFEGLLPASQNDLYTIMDALNVPGSKYSTFARYAGTMTLENPRYLRDGGFDLVGFLEANADVQQQIREQRRPGMWLLVDQALAITESNAQESLRAIGAQRGTKQMPTIVYLRALNPEDDVVVDVVESSENICRYAEEAGLNCFVYYIEEAPHTSYEFNTEEITEVLSARGEEVVDSVSQENAEHALDTYAYYQTGQ